MADEIAREPNGRFLPGGKGGPGRGKSVRRIEGLLRKLGEEMVPSDTPGEEGIPITRLERLMRKVYDVAEDGQQWATQFIAERTEGRVKEIIPDPEGEAQEPIRLLDIGQESGH